MLPSFRGVELDLFWRIGLWSSRAGVCVCVYGCIYKIYCLMILVSLTIVFKCKLRISSTLCSDEPHPVVSWTTLTSLWDTTEVGASGRMPRSSHTSLVAVWTLRVHAIGSRVRCMSLARAFLHSPPPGAPCAPSAACPSSSNQETPDTVCKISIPNPS